MKIYKKVLSDFRILFIKMLIDENLKIVNEEVNAEGCPVKARFTLDVAEKIRQL